MQTELASVKVMKRVNRSFPETSNDLREARRINSSPAKGLQVVQRYIPDLDPVSRDIRITTASACLHNSRRLSKLGVWCERNIWERVMIMQFVERLWMTLYWLHASSTRHGYHIKCEIPVMKIPKCHARRNEIRHKGGWPTYVILTRTWVLLTPYVLKGMHMRTSHPCLIQT